MHGVTIEAEKLDALEIDVLNDDYDFVVGNMILHHIEPLNEFIEKMYSILSIGGIAVFNENFASSRLLMFFRDNICGKFGVYKASDDYEYPITKDEVKMITRVFDDVSVETLEFLYIGMLGKNVFRKSPKLISLFKNIDLFIFNHFLGMRNKSYHQIIKMKKG